MVRWLIPNPFSNYSWVFGFVAALDGLMLCFCLLMIALGKFGMTAPHEDEAIEGPAKSDKAKSSNDSMSDGAFSGDFPMGEIIDEANSDDEQTNAPESLRFGGSQGEEYLHAKAGDIIA